MKIYGIALALLYMGFMVFALYKEKSKNISSLLIAAGAVLIGIYALISIGWRNNLIIILILGMISISAGTFVNGFRKKDLHIHHHLIRLAVETIIIVICRISG